MDNRDVWADETSNVVPMRRLNDLLAGLDPDPYRRGKQFEHICQWFLTHDPVYVHDLRHVWLWKEWPDRWADVEAGIDLVAEDLQGRLWAIQAKCYSQTETITKEEVNKFLSESGRPQFSFRLLIATTNRIHYIAKRTIAEQEKPASLLDLSQLEAAQVDWPRSPSDLRARRLPPKRATGRWAYQQEATKDVVNGFRRADRGQLIMACGTGKTLIALFIAEKLAAERILVLVPSLSLLAQTLREWTANSKENFEFLPVCSDTTVTEPDAAVENTSELGFPVTTDPEEIATFLRRRSGRRVVFATYQSSPEIAKAFTRGRMPLFDLVIADEAHRCGGRVSSDFATVLDAAVIRARRRLFMTATPRYFTGRLVREANDREFEVASMDNEAAFGTVFHRLTFGEAIKRDLLTDYQVAVVGVDDATYRDWAQRGRFVTIDGTKVTDARTLAGQIGVAKAMRRYDLRRTLTFHSRVKRAREFARSLPEVIAWMPARQRPTGQVWADYASGEMPAGQRHVLLQHLRTLDRAQRGLLANARCLAEGVDVPTLDGVAFIDPRRSEVDIVQAVGRAIRRAQDKTVGTVVIPVFINSDEDPEIALDDSAFKPVWDVIKALRSHDEDLGEQLDELRRQLGRQGGTPRLPGKIHLDLPARVSRDFASAFDVRVVEQTTVSWEFWFGLLEHFVEGHGHARVPLRQTVDGYRLGVWVVNQRGLHARGALSADRERRLEGVPGWIWEPFTYQWEENFHRLLQYAERHGHARVPANYVIDGDRLGAWVASQRSSHAKGVLEEDRERRLEGVIGWTWDPVADYWVDQWAEQWEEGFKQLLRYEERQGDARVPSDYTTDDSYRLGWWVTWQRQLHGQGALEADRERRIEELPGWTWDVRADNWEEGFGQLLEYVKRTGDARVLMTSKVDGFNLGSWVKVQRRTFGGGALEADRIRRLEELPGWSWDPFTDQWEEGFRRLADYVRRNGNARVPRSYMVDGYNLGGWAKKQRGVFDKGHLDAERRRRLEDLPGWTWDPFADQWEEGFSRLGDYVEHHGDALVPASYTLDGYNLGSWVKVQRRKHAKGTLDADRERRLQQLSGWKWETLADKWDEGFGRLLNYVKRHGDARAPRWTVTDDGYRLGPWINTQRNNHANGTLDADRERRLEELPGWTWDVRADQWEEGFRRLLDYVERNGDARVPGSYMVDSYRLGMWVANQRATLAKGTLDAERIRRLEAVPGWRWDASADRRLRRTPV